MKPHQLVPRLFFAPQPQMQGPLATALWCPGEPPGPGSCRRRTARRWVLPQLQKTSAAELHAPIVEDQLIDLWMRKCLTFFVMAGGFHLYCRQQGFFRSEAAGVLS